MSILLFTNDYKKESEEKTKTTVAKSTTVAASFTNAHLVVFEDEAINAIKHLEELARKHDNTANGFLPKVPTRLIEDDIEKLLRFMLNDKMAFTKIHESKTFALVSDRKPIGDYLLEISASVDNAKAVTDWHVTVSTHHLYSPYRLNPPAEEYIDLYYNIGGPSDILSKRMINLLKEYDITPEIIKKEKSNY